MRGLAPQLEETRCFSNLAAWQQIFSLSFVQRGTFLLPAAAKTLLDFLFCLFLSYAVKSEHFGFANRRLGCELCALGCLRLIWIFWGRAHWDASRFWQNIRTLYMYPHAWKVSAVEGSSSVVSYDTGSWYWAVTAPLAAAAALTGILGEYLGINFFVVPSLLTHIPQ